MRYPSVIPILLFLSLCLTVSARNEPFIGELTGKDSGISFSVSKGLESADPASRTAFDPGEVLKVNSAELCDRGVDLTFRLSENCFLDHVRLSYSDRKPGAECQVFSLEGRALCEAVRLQAGDNIIPVAAWGDGFVLRFRKAFSFLKGASIEPLKDNYTPYEVRDISLLGAARLGEAVYPLPQSLSYGEGVLPAVSGVKSDRKSAFPAQHFAEQYASRFGKELKPSRKGNLSFTLSPELEKEAFSITVTPEGAAVKGGSERALLYASEKLLQLCTPDGTVRCASIEDAPAFPIRGVHIGLPSRKDLGFMKRVVKELLMPLGYNTVFLQISGAMEYKRHPAINAAWLESIRKWKAGEGPVPAHLGFIGYDILSQDEVKDLCAFFRQYGMEIIPEVQSFGHTQYVTMAYPEMAETAGGAKEEKVDLLQEDARPSIVYHHTSCPNHKDYFKVFFDLIDEVVDVVRPEQYVSIGHDEIYELGLCPLCKAEGAANVYVREVTALHDHIAEKGLKTAMWSDMVDESKYASHAALDRIPKDILCLPFTWYFHLETDQNIEDGLVANGLRFIIGNFYSSHYPRFVSRSGREACLGGEVSTWCAFNETTLGYQGKFYDFLYAAGMLWSPGYREDFRRTYTELANARIGDVRELLHKGALPLGVESVALPLDGASRDNLPYDIRDCFDGALAAGPEADAVIPVDALADRIRIRHATYTPDDPKRVRDRQSGGPVIGTYSLLYDDGSESTEEVTYGETVGTYRWAYGAPMLSNIFRHFGYLGTYFARPVSFKTVDGRDASLWDYPIENPHPEKRIRALRVKCGNERNTRLFIVGAEAQKLTYN